MHSTYMHSTRMHSTYIYMLCMCICRSGTPCASDWCMSTTQHKA